MIVFHIQISADKLDPFDRFSEHYLPLHMKGLYKKAVISALKVSGMVDITVVKTPYYSPGISAKN